MTRASDLVLLDTNILVHLIRNSSVGQRLMLDHSLDSRPERPLIARATVGEIRALGLKLGWGAPKLRHLDDLLHELVIVEPAQGDITERYAEIDHYCEKVVKPARPIGQNDLWIAATAASAGAQLITTDSDFDHLAGQFIRLLKVDPNTGATQVLE